MSLLAAVACGAEPAAPWPALNETAKPWTRWWWPGSAVEREALTSQLNAFSAAGIGGVEITPIYGARGYEARYIEFLSPRWMEMLEHTSREATRLNLGLDMATGTGWPFGGPNVTSEDGSSSIALVDGALAGKPTAMIVKRPAPGGAGLVLDPYSSTAIDHYLERFTRAFATVPRLNVRSQFHDSFEYFNASWTASLPAAFQELNGYDIQKYAGPLMGQQPLDADTLGRVKGDYRRTLAKLHLEYLNAWVLWSHRQGFQARNQAHGAPGNLLDLYGAADIAETESFGATKLPIAGFRAEPGNVAFDADPPLNLVGRFASSASHVMGHPLASSETLTWLRENFRESPAAAKPQIDRLFIAGINHIFYHGTVYSPPDVSWPGWFFYAATQLNPNNPLWDDFAAMNTYVGRVQSVLQAGKPDNDILLYWPFDDLADDPRELMRQYGMHENAWLVDSSAGRMGQSLIDAGYSFDLISDAQLQKLQVEQGALVAPGGRYRVIVVPAARRMSVETLGKLVSLREAGAQMLFESLPDDVPGLGKLEDRRAQFRTLLGRTHSGDVVSPDGVIRSLGQLSVPREGAAAAGLGFIRRATSEGHDYFFVNLSARPFDGWLALGTSAAYAVVLDPLSGRAGTAAIKPASGGNAQVYLQLASGESFVLRSYRAKPRLRGVTPWRYVTPKSDGAPLSGAWSVEFLKGGPVLPQPAQLPVLASWTTLADAEAQRFAGTARYRIEFDAPPTRADDWLLDLGDVREAARVSLNGKAIGSAWSLPFRMRIGNHLAKRGNVLEIEVTNLPANRIRDLDARKVDWKIMNDINLASLRYQALDASFWEVEPSGLVGPVRLTPLMLVSPR
jgi:alpha-L-rhamnosidase